MEAPIIGHQFACGHTLVDAGVRGEKTDAVPYLARLFDDIVPGDGRPAGSRFQDGAEDAKRRRLAGAVGPEQAEDLAGAGVERDVLDGVDDSPSRIAERLEQVLDV